MECNNQQLKVDPTHTYVMGASAAGKSAFLARQLAYLQPQALDPTGELAHKALALYNPQPPPTS